MNPLLVLVLFLLYLPAALICLLAVLFHREESRLRDQERLSQEWLSQQSLRVLQEDREDRL